MKYLTILHKGWPQWDIYLAAQCTIKCNGFGLLMLSLDEPENRLFSWEIPIAGRFPWNMFVCMLQHTEQCSKGAFNNYIDIFAPSLCVEMVFTWTFPRNQNATVKLKSEFISIKFQQFFNTLADPKLICPIQTIILTCKL